MYHIEIKTQKEICKTAPDFYGLFFEDINRAADGGLYPEMLRNRAFEDSVAPAGCRVSEDKFMFSTENHWNDQFNNGEGLKRWLDDVPETPIPAWYAENAEMTLDEEDTLNDKRLASLKLHMKAGGSVSNIGYHGIALKQGEKYHFYMFAKGEADLKLALISKDGDVYDCKQVSVAGDDYAKYEVTFTAVKDDFDARFAIISDKETDIQIGFTSLMPEDTYKGHGMRKDLMQMLENINAKFLRFPGGCIVEGFNKPNAMRFSHTIGPVWERPSQMMVWHYRSTNGLGFHEYLQICEDLGLEAMYVVNCGMTCQGRAPEFFEGDELEAFLQEALDAIEYATADVMTPMGKRRAAAGHPEPFRLKYVEIGNENHGAEYYERYKMFYDVLKEKYPDILYIANTHTEETGLPTEIVDEHIYSSAEYFVTNDHMYDKYDRNKPKIFLGEYAVTAGNDVANLRAALAEAAFLLGAEKNQDVVKLTAYAPLFENVNYKGWHPNMIQFDNHRVSALPTYYSLSLLGKSRGDSVVETKVETEFAPSSVKGTPGFSCFAPGVMIRNPRMDGKDLKLDRIINNGITSMGDNLYITVPDADNVENAFPGVEQALSHFCCYTFESEMGNENVFEAEIKSDIPQVPITMAIWNTYSSVFYRPDETAPESDRWSPIFLDRYTWTITEGKGTVGRVHWMAEEPVGETKDVPFRYGEFNKLKIITTSDCFECYLNDELVQVGKLPAFPALSASADVTDDEIIIKAVNYSDKNVNVKIVLDIAVKPEYDAYILSGESGNAENTLECPENVIPATKSLNGAGEQFEYEMPAWSLNCLRIKKEK